MLGLVVVETRILRPLRVRSAAQSVSPRGVMRCGTHRRAAAATLSSLGRAERRRMLSGLRASSTAESTSLPSTLRRYLRCCPSSCRPSGRRRCSATVAVAISGADKPELGPR